MDNKHVYHELISLLDILEICMKDDPLFKHIRKRILDIANDILRNTDG